MLKDDLSRPVKMTVCAAVSHHPEYPGETTPATRSDEAEDVDEPEPIGPVDTDESYAAAESRFPALVTPVFTAFRTGAGAHSSDERRECPNTVCR